MHVPSNTSCASRPQRPGVLRWIGLQEPDAIRAIFLRSGRSVNFARGDILRAGSAAASILLVERGLCAIYADDGLVPTKVVGLVTPGCSLSMSKSIGDGGPTRLVRALRQVQALSVSPETIREALIADPELSILVARRLLATEESQIDGLLANISMEPDGRLRALLHTLICAYRGGINPGWNLVPLLLNNEEYAAVVHLARVTVSRKFSRWAEQGLLMKNGRQIHVHSDLFKNDEGKGAAADLVPLGAGSAIDSIRARA